MRSEFSDETPNAALAILQIGDACGNAGGRSGTGGTGGPGGAARAAASRRRRPATRFRFVRAHSAGCGRIRRPQCMASAPAAKQAVLKPAPPYGNEILPCHDAGRALPGPPDTKKSLRKTPQACTIYHETHPDQAVAFSSFFMIEKMKSADTRHSTIRMLHSTHRGRPPHSMPMMATI